MASSNQRRRQVARAKYERQQARRLTRAKRRRLWRRVALGVAIAALVGLIVLGIYWIFFADSTQPTAGAHATFMGRAPSPASDTGSIW